MAACQYIVHMFGIRMLNDTYLHKQITHQLHKYVQYTYKILQNFTCVKGNNYTCTLHKIVHNQQLINVVQMHRLNTISVHYHNFQILYLIHILINAVIHVASIMAFMSSHDVTIVFFYANNHQGTHNVKGSLFYYLVQQFHTVNMACYDSQHD